MQPPLRLLLDPPDSGVRNMAADECLLAAASQDGLPRLRFYRWREPTVSLGYFQRLADRDGHSASRGCPIVRRATGGGAIVHDGELTYSFVAPITDRLSHEVAALYRAFHETIVAELAERGVAARLHPGARQSSEPFLCFQRRSDGDVVVDTRLGEHKVLGSAQRRHAGAVLQHGSLLLRASSAAPELPGIRELTGHDLAADELVTALARRLAERLDRRIEPATWSGDEVAVIDRLASTMFDHARWLGRR